MVEFIRIVWELLGKWRRTFIAVVIGLALFEGVKLIEPWLYKETIDTLIASQGSALGRVLWLVAAILVAHLVTMTIDLVTRAIVLTCLFGVERDVACAASQQCFDLSLAFHEREQAGSTVTRVDRGCDKFVELLMDTFWQGLPTVMQMLATTTVMLMVNVEMAVVFAIFIPMFIALSIREQRQGYPHRVRRYAGFEGAFGTLGESIWNMLTIQSFAGERRRQQLYEQHWDTILREGRAQYLYLGTRFAGMKALTINIARTVVLAFAAWKAWSGTLSIGEVVLFLTLSEKAYLSLFRFEHLFARIADSHEGMMRLYKLFREQPAVADVPGAIAPRLHGGVTFDHVSFAYPSADATTAPESVLNGISFTTTPGEAVAFAGPSGGGKSTIVKLLFRHYDVAGGTIFLDEHPLCGLQRTAFREQLGYVPQEGQVFSGSIAENIRFGKPEATDEEIHDAALRAGAHTFITELPKGYATLVGEQGVHLSGGQRQRICIARALVRAPKVLVFDEATSHLDVESERIIQESLERLKGAMTVIVIAHRLSTIRNVDRIFFIERGRITESGSHDALVAQGGAYARHVELQELSSSPERSVGHVAKPARSVSGSDGEPPLSLAPAPSLS